MVMIIKILLVNMALEILFTMYRLMHVTASNIRLYSEIVPTVTAFATK